MTTLLASAGPSGGHARYVRPLTLAGLLLVAAAGAVSTLTPAGVGYVVVAVSAYLPIAALVLRSAPSRHPHARFGAANGVTLARAVLGCLVAGLIATPLALSDRPGYAWAPSATAAVAVLLDLADGRLARRQGLTSAFGARFDIEIDAWLTLALAGVVATQGAVPPWVLLIGAMHYLFLAAGMAMPALTKPLPDSLRRRLIGGSQTLALGVVLAPAISAEAACVIAAVALSALTLSFALDARVLLRRGDGT